MKQIIFFMLLAICIGANAQTRIDAVMDVDSVQRQFILSVPSGVAPSGGYPLVFMFHGTSQDGETFYNESQWKEKGEAEKFITVFPTGLRYCITDETGQHTTTKWHNGELEEDGCPGQNYKDDIHFVRAMLDTIMKTFHIDRRRIYASGFSNGGGFTCKLAVEMSDVFAAVAESGGGLHERDSATPKENIPVWLDVGTKDDKWLAGFSSIGLTEFPFNDSTLLYFGSQIRRFIGVFGLDTAHTKDSTKLALIYRFTTPSGSTPTTEFRFSLIDNMFHVYPNGTNNQIVAANVFWDFFNHFTQTLSVPDAPGIDHTINIYPNPASDYLFIDGAGEMTVTLRTVLGQSVFTTTTTSGRRIDLSGIAPGLYIADVSDARTRSARIILLR